MRQRFPRRSRPLVAVAALTFASFGVAAASHVARSGPDLYARLAVIQVCRAPDEQVRRDAVAMLRRLGAKARPAVLGRARAGEVPDELFAVVAELADAEAVDVLAAGVSGGEAERRLLAVQGLARIGTREAALALGPALADPKQEVRQAAKQAIRGHGAEVIAAGVRAALGAGSMIPEFIREVLVEAGMVGAAVEPVAEALASGDPMRVGNALYLAKFVFPEFPPGRERERAIVRAVSEVVPRLDAHGQSLAVETLAELDFEGRNAALCAIARDRRFPESVRVQAIQGVGARRDPAAVAALEELLRVPRHPIRAECARALGRTGSPQDAERWLGILEEGRFEYEVRELMFGAVAAAGEAALLPRLLRMLGSMETPALHEAIRTLAAGNPRAAVPEFLALLRDAAPQHLAWINGELQDLTWHRSALGALPRTMEEFVRQRAETHREWQGWWAANGARTPEEWRAAGMAEIESDLRSPAAAVRFEALGRLLRLDPPDLESKLVSRLDDPEEFVWAKAQEALVARAAPGTREHLRAVLEWPQALPASRAARLLGLLEDRTAVDGLLRASERPDTAVRRECAFALGRLADTRATPALLRLLRDGEAAVAAEARVSLETLADRSVEGEMMAGLRAPDRDYRLACVSILGRAGGRACIRPLAALFDDADEELRVAAVRAVQSLIGRVPSLRPTDLELRDWERALEFRGR